MNIYTNSPDEQSISGAVSRMQYLIDTIPALLKQLPDTDFSQKPAPDKWSKKEILGHLIDSATNNHQRFIRLQYQDKPGIYYDQNEWVSFSNYVSLEKERIIDFWAQYNNHLLHIMKHIPSENLIKTGIVRVASEEKPLYFFINDYVAHMEHHLRQIVSY
jgi:hypothetical protein